MSRPATWISCLPQSLSRLLALPRRNCFSRPASQSMFGRILCLVLFAFLAALPARAQAAEPAVPLGDHVPPQLLEGHTTLLGHYNPQQKLRLTLALKPPHLAEEEQFLRDLTDKTSPNFHKFLTPEEWNARFAPSAADEQAVVDWATSHGFTVTNRFNHRLIVDVAAPAGVIEKTLGVTINR